MSVCKKDHNYIPLYGAAPCILKVLKGHDKKHDTFVHTMGEQGGS